MSEPVVNLHKMKKGDAAPIISLEKKSNPSLCRVAVAGGWDADANNKPASKPKKGGLFGGLLGGGGSYELPPASDFDLDVFAFLLRNDKLSRDDRDIVYFGNKCHSSGAIASSGDNLTGKGDGDDETIAVDLSRIPKDCNRIVFGINIYQAKSKRQHFGYVKNAFMRVYDKTTGKQLCRFNLTDDYDGMTYMICGELQRGPNDTWDFVAIGEGGDAPSINAIANRYR